METLVFHISKLLESADCVILPNLGGFVSHNHSAHVDEKKHKFSPPGKHLSFNQRLVKNDGLLANQIALEEDISFNEAMNVIEEHVAQIKSKLSKGKSVHFGFLGSLKLDQGQIVFTKGPSVIPSKSNFGLESFHAVPATELPKKKETKILPHPAKATNKWWAAAAVIPLAVYFTWLPLSSGMMNPGYEFEASDLNPFSSTTTEQATYQTRQHWLELSDEEPSTPKLPESTARYVELKLVESDKTLVVELNPQKKEATPKLADRQHGYFTIVGCFGEKSNAHKLIGQLHEQGVEASIIDQHKGLYRVATGHSDHQAEARRELARIKKIQPGAWLLKK